MELPKAFLERMKEFLPENEYEPFVRSYDNEPKKGIRINRLKTHRDKLKLPEAFKAEEIPWCEDGLYIKSESRPGKQPAYYTGLYYPQEPSAMIPGEVIEINEGDLVLDLCAAPGGKSTQIAAKLNGTGALVSNEIVKSRVGILASNIERLGVKNAIILNENPKNLTKNFKQSFDKILVDAPCSGEGMFRKDNAVISEWDESRPDRCALRQTKILETVDQLLKPGGELVYSTCTFAPEENELVIADFLDHYDYELLPVELEGVPKIDLNLNVDKEITDKTLRVFPHRSEGEGHFVARLRKKGKPEYLKKNKGKNKNLKKASKNELKDFKVFAQKYLPDFSLDNIYIYKNKLIKIPEALTPEDLTGLSVVSAGLELGELKKNRFEPSQALAMSLKKNDFENRYELGEDELWCYLKGIEVKPKEALKPGWVLMCYEGNPVGFGKYSNTIKNKYPKGLRIKKNI